MTEFALTRRGVLTGSAVVVVGMLAGYLAGRNSAGAPTSYSGTTDAAAPSSGGGGRLLAPVADVPKGGGTVLAGPKIVLTRGSDDTVRAFSAVCTHAGCTVNRVAAGTIVCPCHGSRFDAATGAVTSGPATRPLPRVAVVVRNGKVFTT